MNHTWEQIYTAEQIIHRSSTEQQNESYMGADIYSGTNHTQEQQQSSRMNHTWEQIYTAEQIIHRSSNRAAESIIHGSSRAAEYIN